MALVRACDFCGNTFVFKGEDKYTGNWNWKNVKKDDRDYRVVFGVFQYQEGERTDLARGGKAIDCCLDCTDKLIKGE